MDEISSTPVARVIKNSKLIPIHIIPEYSKDTLHSFAIL